MEEIKLEVQVRKEKGTRDIKAIRRNNLVPAVVYGGKKESALIQVDRKSFERIRRAHIGETIIFKINVMEGDKKVRDYSAIIKEEQHDPVNENLLHIDFNSISLTEKIEVKVPLVAKGEAIGVKRDGGSLDHVIWELDVVCLPTQIPQNIEVDVSNLEIGDSVHVKDLKLPEGVVTKHNQDSIVFHVVPPMKEVAPDEAPAAPGEVEVIKEKKDKAVEGEVAGAAPAGKKEEKKEEKK